MSSNIICSSFFNYILNIMILYHVTMVTYFFSKKKKKKKSNQEKLK